MSNDESTVNVRGNVCFAASKNHASKSIRLKELRSTRAALAAFSFCLLLLGGNLALAQTLQDKAWNVLQAGLAERNTGKRAAAVRALGLLQGDPRAIASAEMALADKKAVVRAAAATALGQMGAKSSIPLLKEALADKENRVFFASADALLSLGDPAGYDLYYDILAGDRKSGESLIAAKKKLLADPRAMTLLAVGVGIGYAPYATYGWMVWKEVSKDYRTPVRVEALNKLGNDQDSRIGQALVKAASDKHESVRIAALSAIGRHGDPRLMSQVSFHMTDRKAPVRYTAAAAVLRLSALASSNDATDVSEPAPNRISSGIGASSSDTRDVKSLSSPPF